MYVEMYANGRKRYAGSLDGKATVEISPSPTRWVIVKVRAKLHPVSLRLELPAAEAQELAQALLAKTSS